MKRMLESNMCSQYKMADNPMLKDLDPSMRKQMREQADIGITELNIQYEQNFGKKYNYKKKCK